MSIPPAPNAEALSNHAVVPRDRWLAARRQLLARERELTRLGDELSAQRRELPWVRIDTPYVFETENGPRTLADLFDTRSQLIVYHFMFGPDWEEGCTGCSFLSDHLDGPNLHLRHHDVSLVAVSRAPLAKLLAFRQRMGWKFPWVSSLGNGFNHDFHVSFRPEELSSGQVFYNHDMLPSEQAFEELPGLSVFYRDAHGRVFHTYSTYARGLDALLGAHHLLDLTPRGRNETGTMDWVRHHDRYESSAPCACSCDGHPGGAPDPAPSSHAAAEVLGQQPDLR